MVKLKGGMIKFTIITPLKMAELNGIIKVKVSLEMKLQKILFDCTAQGAQDHKTNWGARKDRTGSRLTLTCFSSRTCYGDRKTRRVPNYFVQLQVYIAQNHQTCQGSRKARRGSQLTMVLFPVPPRTIRPAWVPVRPGRVSAYFGLVPGPKDQLGGRKARGGGGSLLTLVQFPALSRTIRLAGVVGRLESCSYPRSAYADGMTGI